jgi:hypothetical protein
LAQINTGIVFTNAELRSDWMEAMRKQQDFIYSQMHQEGLRDDIEYQQWHESNALKVPYTAADDSFAFQQTIPVTAIAGTNSGSGSGGSNTPAGSGPTGQGTGLTPPLSPYEPVSAVAHHAMPTPSTPMGFRSPPAASMFQRRLAYPGAGGGHRFGMTSVPSWHQHQQQGSYGGHAATPSVAVSTSFSHRSGGERKQAFSSSSSHHRAGDMHTEHDDKHSSGSRSHARVNKINDNSPHSHDDESGDDDEDAPPRDAHRRRGDALHPESLQFTFTAPRRSFTSPPPGAHSTSDDGQRITTNNNNDDNNNLGSPSDHRPMRTPRSSSLSSRRRRRLSGSSSEDSVCSDDSFHSAGSGDDDTSSLPPHPSTTASGTPLHASIPRRGSSESEHSDEGRERDPGDDGGNNNSNRNDGSATPAGSIGGGMPLPSVEEDGGWPWREVHHALRVEASAPPPDPFIVQLVHLTLRPYAHSFLIPRAHRYGNSTSGGSGMASSSSHTSSLQSQSRRPRSRRESNFSASSPYLSDATLAGTSAGAFLELPFVDFELRHHLGTPHIPGSSASTSRPPLYGAGFHHFAGRSNSGPSSATTGQPSNEPSSSHSPYDIYGRPSSRTGGNSRTGSGSGPASTAGYQHHLSVPGRAYGQSPAPPETPFGNPSLTGYPSNNSGTPGLTPTNRAIAAAATAAATLASGLNIGTTPRTPQTDNVSLRNRLQDSRPTADFGFFEHATQTADMESKRERPPTAHDRSDIGHRFSVVGDDAGTLQRLFDPTITKKRHIDINRDIHIMVTPLFITSLDHYMPIIQAPTSTLEDTLDEMHKQFARAFSSAKSQPSINHIPAPVLHVLTSQLSISMPTIHIDLIQLSGALNFNRGANPSSRRSSMDLDGRRSARKGLPSFGSPTPGSGSSERGSSCASTVFFSSLYLDGLQIHHQSDIPRPDSVANPSSQTSISLQCAYAYSSLLVASRPVPFSPSMARHGTGGVRQSSIPRSFSFSLDKDAFIPPSRLARYLADDVLQSQAVFFSCQIGFSMINLTHTLQVSGGMVPSSSFNNGRSSMAPSPADPRTSVRNTPNTGPNNNSTTIAGTAPPSRTVVRSPAAGRRASPQMTTRGIVPSSPMPVSSSASSKLMSPGPISRSVATPPGRHLSATNPSGHAFAPSPFSPIPTMSASHKESKEKDENGRSPATTIRRLPGSHVPSQPQLLIVPPSNLGGGPSSPRGGSGGSMGWSSAHNSRIDTTSLNLVQMANTPPLSPNLPSSPRGGNKDGGARLFRSMSSSAVSPTHAKRPTLARGAAFTGVMVTESDEKRWSNDHDGLAVGRDETDEPLPLPAPHLQLLPPPAVPLPPATDAYTNTNAQNHVHHNGIRIRLDQVSILTSGHSPCMILTALDTWTYAASKLELPAAMTQPLGPLDHAPDKLTQSIEGGPGNRLRLARWQTVLSFALKHILHSRALDGRYEYLQSFACSTFCGC